MNPLSDFSHLSRDMEEALIEAGTKDYLNANKYYSLSNDHNVVLENEKQNCDQESHAKDSNSPFVGLVSNKPVKTEPAYNNFLDEDQPCKNSFLDKDQPCPEDLLLNNFGSDFFRGGDLDSAADFLTMDFLCDKNCCQNTFEEFDVPGNGCDHKLSHYEYLTGGAVDEICKIEKTERLDEWFEMRDGYVLGCNDFIILDEVKDIIDMARNDDSLQHYYSESDPLNSSEQSFGNDTFSTVSLDDISPYSSSILSHEDSYSSSNSESPRLRQNYSSAYSNNSVASTSTSSWMPGGYPFDGAAPDLEPSLDVKSKGGKKSRSKNKSSEGSQSSVQRACLLNYSPDEKKAHIREQNNKASREYRKRRKNQIDELSGQVKELEDLCEENRKKKAIVEKKVDIMTRAISVLWQRQGASSLNE